jgi:ParB family chromosome partitioning protein
LLGNLPQGYGEPPATTSVPTEPQPGALLQLHVHDLEPNPFQPRRDFDAAELASLAESLRQHGLLQPVSVRRVGERYQLVAGERRWRAAIAAGWETVPAQLVEADDRQATELAIVENLQRQDLNALEKAASFEHYLATYGCTQEELAQRLQIDRSTVSNLIRLLELPAEVQQSLRNGAITQGHARALLPLDDEREQVALCRQIKDEGLSVRAVESLVQGTLHAAEEPALSSPAPSSASAPAERSRPTAKRAAQVSNLEQELRGALGTKVEIRSGARGKGKIIVHFANHHEFERLMDMLTAEYVDAHRAAG